MNGRKSPEKHQKIWKEEKNQIVFLEKRKMLFSALKIHVVHKMTSGKVLKCCKSAHVDNYQGMNSLKSD